MKDGDMFSIPVREKVTVLDFFAGCALAGIVAAGGGLPGSGGASDWEQVSSQAYKAASIMRRERENTMPSR